MPSSAMQLSDDEIYVNLANFVIILIIVAALLYLFISFNDMKKLTKTMMDDYNKVKPSENKNK